MAIDERDLEHLHRAIDLARAAREHGNHPFGSLLTDAAGAVVLEAENTVVTARDVAGHAELNLVRLAGERYDAATLGAFTLYTSTEPCAMCAGAIFWSGIGRVVFALSCPTLGALVPRGDASGILGMPCREVFARAGRVVAVDGPALLEEASAVHAGFWT